MSCATFFDFWAKVTREQERERQAQLAADRLIFRRDVGDRDREYFDNHPMNKEDNDG